MRVVKRRYRSAARNIPLSFTFNSIFPFHPPPQPFDQILFLFNSLVPPNCYFKDLFDYLLRLSVFQSVGIRSLTDPGLRLESCHKWLSQLLLTLPHFPRRRSHLTSSSTRTPNPPLTSTDRSFSHLNLKSPIFGTATPDSLNPTPQCELHNL